GAPGGTGPPPAEPAPAKPGGRDPRGGPGGGARDQDDGTADRGDGAGARPREGEVRRRGEPARPGSAHDVPRLGRADKADGSAVERGAGEGRSCHRVGALSPGDG